MGKRQLISAEVKKEVMKFLEEGKTQRNIAIMSCLSQPSVSNIVKQRKIDNTGQQSKWPKYKNNCLESMLLR